MKKVIFTIGKRVSTFISIKVLKFRTKELCYAATLILCFNNGAMAQDKTYQVTQKSDKGTPTFITFNANTDITHENFYEKMTSEFGFKPEDKLVLVKTDADKNGFTHYKYNQTYKNIPVFGAQFIIHEKNSLATSANGKFIANLTIKTIPVLSQDDAIKNAMKELGLTKYRWEDKRSEENLKEKTKNPNATHFPKPILAIAPLNGDYKKGEFHLCWQFNIAGATLDKAWTVFIDAHNGQMINKISLVHDVDYACTATTYYNGTQNIAALWSTTYSVYVLAETSTRGPTHTQNIVTKTANHDSLPSQGGNVYNTSQFIGSATTSFTFDPVANNAHWGAEMTYDYYYNFNGRNSVDNNGFIIVNFVHYKTNLDNAYWTGYDTLMVYGDGDGSLMGPVVGLDVEGHELSHGVTQFSAQSIYQGESGALDESFSDIMGTGVEAYTLGSSADWFIGENVILISPYYLRSMADPKSGPASLGCQQPNTYGGQYWYPTTGTTAATDYGGVHTNSGVQNFWFYLLSVGGSGTNDIGTAYSVAGIGISDALHITYRNQTVYMFPSAQYADAMTGTIQSAADLFGATSAQVQSVKDAWCAVGVGSCSSSAIQTHNQTGFNTFSYNTTIITNGTIPQGTQLKVVNALGQVILNTALQNNIVTNLPSGIYTMQVIDNTGSILEIKKCALISNN